MSVDPVELSSHPERGGSDAESNSVRTRFIAVRTSRNIQQIDAEGTIISDKLSR